VIRDELIAIGQRSLADERLKAVGEDRTDQQHRFAGAGDLVFQLDTVYECVLHGSTSCAVFATGVQRSIGSCSRSLLVSGRFDPKA
jgi:hypothetical protein